MLFQIYGENAGWQLFGWLMVFVCLIAVNEIARRSKVGGIFCFFRQRLPYILSLFRWARQTALNGR